MARWTARMLASLAVVVACSLGAATLPLGPAATAHAASPTVAVDRAALDAGQLGDVRSTGVDRTLRALIRWSDRAAHAVARAGAGSSGPAARIGTGSPEAAGWTASGSAEADSAVAAGPVATRAAAAGDRQVGPVDVLDPMVRGVVVAPSDRHRVLVGLVPATVGSRAPPAR
ncbi:hypothetical protein ONA91_11215 [Micromonospora sp. DR5-3]|uniref:hypothetical protein n=1 Tax=Micromonospora sp. DR5-3 TaxID=2992129 RepID=UPI002232329F|nr:hypothetical protein [Micromonospora sp. DR5-3]MCW3815026.1 hypothetical protein [Micromonospora sp. DR5-3]